MQYLAKGKRSIVYTISYKGKLAAIKQQRKDSSANNVVEREFEILKKLNKHSIGPKAYALSSGLIMELLKGPTIEEYITKASRASILIMLSKVLKKLRKLDSLGYSKQEMTNPYKHIIITKKGPRLLDFERCRFTRSPSNVTQFLNYLYKKKMQLAAKGIFILDKKLRPLAARYKRKLGKNSFKPIFDEVMQKGFAARVYFEVSKIPQGRVSSYKAIAEKLGSRAYRAIGQALNKNPFWPIVPCHRILASDGSLGGFARGEQEKLRLLKAEGVSIENQKIIKTHRKNSLD